MPWEITIRRRDGGMLGNAASIGALLQRYLTGLEVHQEPSGADKIRAGEAAGVRFPEIVRKVLQDQPASVRADCWREEGSVCFFLGQGGEVDEVHVEVRGCHVPAAEFAALAGDVDWVFIDDANQMAIDWRERGVFGRG